jgi:hypothetical protein
MPHCKWKVAGAAVFLGLGLPANGMADDYATRGPTPKFKFQVVSEGGEPKKVKRFVFRRVRIDCTSGQPSPFLTKSISPHFGPFRVGRKGRFGRTFTSDSGPFRGTTEIRGKFVTRRRVDGTLQIDGEYPPTYAGCSSGEVIWTARID